MTEITRGRPCYARGVAFPVSPSRGLRAALVGAALVMLAIEISSADCNLPPNMEKYAKETTPHRIALVAGNADYVSAVPLPGSLTDAEQIAAKLKSLGFTLEPAVPAQFSTRADFITSQFEPFLEKIHEGDFVVFYFSGHGFSFGGETYITPLDFPATVPEHKLFRTFLSESALRGLILKRRPALLLMILDACRTIGGPVSTGTLGSDSAVKEVEFRFTGAYPEMVTDNGSLVPLATDFTQALTHIPINSMTVYASDTGTPAIGSKVGALSHFTAGLVRHLDQRGELFPTTMTKVKAYVQTKTESTQKPVLSDPSPTYVYFKPGRRQLQDQCHDWRVALKNQDQETVKNYRLLWALGPYSGAAQQWLADHETQAPANATMTRVAAFAPEVAWDKGIADGTRVSVAGVTGDLAMTRSARSPLATPGPGPDTPETQPSIMAADLPQIVSAGREKPPVQTALHTAETLAAHGEALVLPQRGVTVYADTSADAPALGQAHYMQRLRVDGLKTGEDGSIWSKVRLPGDDRNGFVAISEPRRQSPEDLGIPLQEIYLASAADDLTTRIDSRQLTGALARIQRDGPRITWISITTAKTDDPRLRAILRARAAHALVVATESGVRRGIITILEGADFEGARIRLRIFGNRSD